MAEKIGPSQKAVGGEGLQTTPDPEALAAVLAARQEQITANLAHVAIGLALSGGNRRSNVRAQILFPKIETGTARLAVTLSLLGMEPTAASVAARKQAAAISTAAESHASETSRNLLAAIMSATGQFNDTMARTFNGEPPAVVANALLQGFQLAIAAETLRNLGTNPVVQNNE